MARKAHNRLELVGQKFGRLLVVSESTEWNRYKKSVWVCQCDCGNMLEVVGGKLTIGHTQSCGCLQKERSAEVGKKNRGRGRDTIVRQPIEATIHALYLVKRGNARRRGWEFTLTEEQFKLISEQACFYCGRLPSARNTQSGGYTYESDFISNGIDRVNTLQGYTIENSVPCCKHCNWEKGPIKPSMVKILYDRLVKSGDLNE